MESRIVNSLPPVSPIDLKLSTGVRLHAHSFEDAALYALMAHALAAGQPGLAVYRSARTAVAISPSFGQGVM